jgi:fumarate reductase subunit C
VNFKTAKNSAHALAIFIALFSIFIFSFLLIYYKNRAFNQAHIAYEATIIITQITAFLIALLHFQTFHLQNTEVAYIYQAYRIMIPQISNPT